MAVSIRASKQGLQRVDQARRKKGWKVKALAWCDAAGGISPSTLDRFRSGVPIEQENFVAICKAVGIGDWESIADFSQLPASTSSEAEDVEEVDYWQNLCRKMLDRQKSLSTNEIIASEPLQFDLTSDDIYVSLALVERKEPPRYPSDINPEQGLQQQEQPPIEYEQFQEEVLRLGKGKSRGQRIAIVGEPGAGKTTLLQKTAFWILEKQLGFPIWISPSDLGLDSSKLQHFKTYIFNEWLRDTDFNVTDDIIADFERHIKETTVWLLLDGVDEVSQSSSSLKEIADQLRGWLSESRIILSCRQNLWEMQPNALQDFETYRVKEFTYPDKVQRFITNGFRRNNSSSGERLIAELGKPERTRLRSLVQNPLRLMLLCSTWHEGLETLPETKAELFAMFVGKFYKWKMSRWQQEDWYQKKLKTRKQREALNLALGNLAIRALDQEFEDKFSHNSFFRLSYDLVEDVLGDPEDNDTPSFFWLALKLNWLLEARKAENPRERVYAFAHPSFQEYFAACSIQNKDFFINHNNKEPNPFKEYKNNACTYRILKSRWKEVFLLWLGRSEKKIEEQKTQIIQELVEFEDECDSYYGTQAYFLATASISELKTCALADSVIIETVKLCLGYFDKQQQKWMRGRYPVPALAKLALLEADHNKVVDVIVEQIVPDSIAGLHPNENSAQDAAEILGLVGKDNPKAIAALIDLISSEISTFYWVRSEASKSLVEIAKGNGETIRQLRKLLSEAQDEEICVLVAETLGEISPNDPYALNFLTERMHSRYDKEIRWKAAWYVLSFDAENPTALSTMHNLNSSEDRSDAGGEYINYSEEDIRIYTEYLDKCSTLLELFELLELLDEDKPEWIQQQTISKILEQVLEQAKLDYSSTVKILTEQLHVCRNECSLQLIVEILGEISVGDENVVRSLLQLLLNSKSLVAVTPQSLSKILKGASQNELCALAVRSLKDYLKESDFERSFRCWQIYEVVWHCVRNMSYPDFYRAWHDQA